MAKGKTKKSEETRALILNCSIELFNSQSVHAISTHHIAEAAGLSPGNLYYHFRNKEEIVREIFQQCHLFSPDRWRGMIQDRSGEGFRHFLEFYFSHIKNFRFLFRERAMLVKEDPGLRELWLKTDYELRIAMREAVLNWIETDIMIPFDSDKMIDAFIDNSWIILNFSASYFEIQEKHSGTNLETSVMQNFLAFLRPYHTTKGQSILDEHFAPVRNPNNITYLNQDS